MYLESICFAKIGVKLCLLLPYVLKKLSTKIYLKTDGLKIGFLDRCQSSGCRHVEGCKMGCNVTEYHSLLIQALKGFLCNEQKTGKRFFHLFLPTGVTTLGKKLLYPFLSHVQQC